MRKELDLKKWAYVLLTTIFIFTMTVVPSAAPPSAVRAQEGPPRVAGTSKAFLPMILKPAWLYIPLLRFMEPILEDTFDTGPGDWEMVFRKDPKDGWFEHWQDRYLAIVRDNSAMIIASPGWRPSGDFKVEVDGKHKEPRNKTFNGLGLAFDATDDWNGYYALMIAAGAAQHSWALVRFRNTRAKYLTNKGYRGGPTSMRNYTGWNRLMVIRIGDTIRVYNNGSKLPNGTVVDTTYGPAGLVGVVATSYEFDKGRIEYDNFKLTPLYEEDIVEYEDQGMENAVYEFDTPALDLHK